MEHPFGPGFADTMFAPGPATDDLKRAFAEVLLRMPDDPYGAARLVEPHMGKAQFISAYWLHDPLVVAHMETTYAVKGAAAVIPTKDEFAASVLKLAHEYKTADSKLDFLKLFASVVGYIEKPSGMGGGNTTINNTVNKVMIVHKNDNRRLAVADRVAHQARLVNDASSS